MYFIGETEDTNFLPTNILCLMPRPSIESRVLRKFYHKLLPPPSGNYTTLQILILKKSKLVDRGTIFVALPRIMGSLHQTCTCIV